jgi:hypothetical protein
MKTIMWMALGALLCATGCDESKKAINEPSAPPEVKEATKEAAKDVAEAVTAPKALKAPISAGVEPGFAYSNVVEMKMPATDGGEQRTVKLWVKELPPKEAVEKLAEQLKGAGFEESSEKTMHIHQFKKGAETINLNLIDFKPGDKNGLGMVDVTIITQ